MHLYRNIIMHSVQNLNYIFFINIYLIKNSWPRVFNTRVHLDTCNKYTWPNRRVYLGCV
jgi:hypothetical protein